MEQAHETPQLPFPPMAWQQNEEYRLAAGQAWRREINGVEFERRIVHMRPNVSDSLTFWRNLLQQRIRDNEMFSTTANNTIRDHLRESVEEAREMIRIFEQHLSN